MNHLQVILQRTIIGVFPYYIQINKSNEFEMVCWTSTK